MTMLPDIDQASYDEYEKQQLQRDIEQKQQSFGLQNAINEKIAGLQSLVGGAASAVGGAIGVAPPAATPTPPPTEPVPVPPAEPAPDLSAQAPAPPPEPSQAEPEPAPAPAPELPAPDAPPPARFAPTPTPAPAPTPTPTPAPGAAAGGGLSDWWTNTMGAAVRAGADMQAFSSNLSTTGGDLVGSALGAAIKAGADPHAFMASMTAPPQAPTTPAASAATGAPAGPPVRIGQGQEAFVSSLQPLAARVSARTGIDPNVMIAIAANETGWGQSQTAKEQNNLFSIQGPSGQGSRWATYDSPEQSFEAFANLISTAPRYRQAWADRGDPVKFVNDLRQAGYVVDEPGFPAQGWVNQVTSINNRLPPAPEAGVVDRLTGAGQQAAGAAGAAGGWLGLAKEQLNKPYIWGSGSGAGGRGSGDIDPNTGLPKGFDCSGYVSWVLKNGLGVDLPAQTASAYGKTQAIDASQARPGDVVFYNMDQNDPHMQHMALYIGDGQIIQAGGTSRAVNIDSVSAVGRPEFRRAAGTDAADSRQLVGASVQGAGGFANDVAGSSGAAPAAPPQFQVDQPLTDTSGRLTAAATGRPDDTYMGTMQAASVGESQPLAQPAQPAQSPVDKLKSAFGDFLDSLGGMTQQPAGQPAQSQAIPSDTLTNPLGSRYAEPTSAALTGQPASGIAAPSGPAILPSLGDAKDALARGDTQAAIDALSQAGSAASSSTLAQQLINPPDRPLSPGSELRENIANAPLLGGLLGMARGPELVSGEEVLQSREAQTARGMLEQIAAAQTAKGQTPEPITDQEVIDTARGLMTSNAVAMTGEGFGRPASPSELARRAPRLSEGAVPATGAGQMAQAFDQLSVYPEWVRSGIEDFVGKMGDAPPSEVASTVYRWMQDNPLASVTDHPGVAMLEKMSTDLENIHQSTTIRSGGAQPEKGQLGFEDSAFGRGAQPLMPEGEGGFNPEMLLPDYVPKTDLEAQKLAEIRGGIDMSRAARMARGEPDVPTSNLVQRNVFGEPVNVQGALEEGGGKFHPDMLLPDYKPKSALEEQRINEIWGGISDARAKRYAEGRADVPTTGLEDVTLPGMRRPDLELPRFVPDAVKELIQDAHQAVPDRIRTSPFGVADVKELADAARTKPSRINRMWKPDTPEGQQIVQALQEAITQSSSDLQRAQDKLKLDPEAPGVLAEMVQQLTRHQALQDTIAGMPSEAGAALQRVTSPRRLTREAAVARHLDDVAERLGLDKEKLADVFAKADLKDPDKLAEFAKATGSYSFGDKIGALWYFAMLSSPKTHIRNMVGNTMVGLTRPAETLGSAFWDPVSRKLLGEEGPRQRYYGEVGNEIKGALSSLPDGVRQGWQAMKEGWVPEAAGDTEVFNREAFRNTRGEFVGYAGRALQGEDQFYRAINEGASKHGLAYRKASQEGLTGEAQRNRVAELIQKPDDAMRKEMEDTAAYRVFQQKSAFASWLNQGRDKWPALRYLIPFTRTPINVAKFAGERSPLGLVKLGIDAATPAGRRELRRAGSGQLSDRLSRASIGSLTWAGLVWEAAQGNLTGAAPEDPAERDAYYRRGLQPYSFRNPATGEWTSYTALSPYSQLLSTAADTVKAVQDQKMDDPNDLYAVGAAMSMAIGHAMIDQPWTQGFADVLDMFGSGQGPQSSDPKKLAQWAGKQAGGVVPGAIRDASRVVDNVIRDPTNPVEAVEANLPFLSKNVPAKLNAMGQERTRPDSGAGGLLNVFPSTRESTSLVESELARLQRGGYGAEPGLVGQNVTAFDQPVDLTDEQQAKYQRRSGVLAYTLLSGLIGSDEWNAMTDTEKAKQVDQIFSDMRKASRETMMPELVHQAAESYRRSLERRASVAIPSSTQTAATSTAVPAGAGG